MGQVVGLRHAVTADQAAAGATTRERGIQMVDSLIADGVQDFMVIGWTPDHQLSWIAESCIPLDTAIVSLLVIHSDLLDARREGIGSFDDMHDEVTDGDE